MKKLFITTVLLLLGTLTNAQDFKAKTKGTYMAGGSMYIDYRSDAINGKSSTSFTTSINPKLGYFIKNNILVGGEISYQSSSSGSGLSSTETSGGALIALGRYYFDNNFFAEIAPGFGFVKTKTSLSDTNSPIYGIRIGAGYAYFLGNHVAIEPTINYRYETSTTEMLGIEMKRNISSIFFGLGISAYF